MYFLLLPCPPQKPLTGRPKLVGVVQEIHFPYSQREKKAQNATTTNRHHAVVIPFPSRRPPKSNSDIHASLGSARLLAFGIGRR